MPDFSLSKGERLASRKSISSLFQSGQAVHAYPFRILYAPVPEGSDQLFPVSMAISVPKRLFRRAVDRNLLKRRIREAYRLNKPELYGELKQMDRRVILVIQYQHREIADFETIRNGLLGGLGKMTLQLGRQ